MSRDQRPAHGGAEAITAARRHGVTTLFTLSGGHVFPVYDGAVRAEPPMRIVDVRHEQTAVFAAEATARLTRSPGFAVLTAGPGVTNGVSAVTTAHFNGSPLVVLAGRAPDGRWGSGSLQELDHPPLLAPVTKAAWTAHSPGTVGAAVDEAFAIATARHRGPVFLDASLEALFGVGQAAAAGPGPGPGGRRDVPDAGSIEDIARLLASTLCLLVLILGSGLCLADRAEDAARTAAELLRLPVVANGQGAAPCPPGTRCWSPGPDRPRSPRRTWCSWRARRWTSGSATAAWRCDGAALARWCTSRTRRSSWPGTASWPGQPRAT